MPQIEDFMPYQGTLFHPPGGAAPLRLAQVEALPPGFCLLFQGPAQPVLPSGMHEWLTEDGGAFTFHIMPVHTPVPGRQDYQAVFV